MGKSNIVKALNELKTADIYSAMLFILYKLNEIPEYSAVSELPYVIQDKQSLLNFLDFYGGTTIKVPTKQEFQTVLDTLLLYQYVNIDNIDFDTAVYQLNKSDYQVKDIKACYSKVAAVLNNYDFKRGN